MNELVIVKKVDTCGRVSIPKGIRHSLNIQYGDKVGVSMTNNCINIVKIQEGIDVCIFCGASSDAKFKDVSVCQDCVEEMYATT